jgi:tetratricopeptide (TPR) repeat protein
MSLRATPLADIPDVTPPAPPAAPACLALPAPADEQPPCGDVERLRARFALHQLSVAEGLLMGKKPAVARKEFNRARMAWSTCVDLSKAPAELVHSALSLPADRLRAFVDVRALYGVARTFLAIDPPQEKNAIVKLREAREIDPACEDVLQLLADLGVRADTEEEFPPMSDASLRTQQFWMREKVPWEKRVEYTIYARQEGTSAFAKEDYKAALNAYNRAQNAFAGQALTALSSQQKSEMVENLTLSRLNMLACYFEMEQYLQVIVNANGLLDFIAKTGMEMNWQKIKCLYRKAKALLKMNQPEKVVTTMEELRQIPESAPAIAKLEELLEEDRRTHQVELDFMYQKMMGTLK